MIASTRAIVVGYIKYGDSSIIVKAYTEQFGFQSFIVNGIRSAKAKQSIGLYQPCTLLEVVFYRSPNKELHRLSEAKIVSPTPTFQADYRKGAMIIFFSELLNKLLYADHTPHPELFDFLWHNIAHLDSQASGYESFHIYLLVKIAAFLGFGIHHADDVLSISNTHSDEQKWYLEKVIGADAYLPDTHSGDFRKNMVEMLMTYYHHHIDHLTELKSVKILHQIFH